MNFAPEDSNVPAVAAANDPSRAVTQEPEYPSDRPKRKRRPSSRLRDDDLTPSLPSTGLSVRTRSQDRAPRQKRRKTVDSAPISTAASVEPEPGSGAAQLIPASPPSASSAAVPSASSRHHVVKKSGKKTNKKTKPPAGVSLVPKSPSSQSDADDTVLSQSSLLPWFTHGSSTFQPHPAANQDSYSETTNVTERNASTSRTQQKSPPKNQKGKKASLDNGDNPLKIRLSQSKLRSLSKNSSPAKAVPSAGLVPSTSTKSTNTLVSSPDTSLADLDKSPTATSTAPAAATASADTELVRSSQPPSADQQQHLPPKTYTDKGTDPTIFMTPTSSSSQDLPAEFERQLLLIKQALEDVSNLKEFNRNLDKLIESHLAELNRIKTLCAAKEDEKAKTVEKERAREEDLQKAVATRDEALQRAREAEARTATLETKLSAMQRRVEDRQPEQGALEGTRATFADEQLMTISLLTDRLGDVEVRLRERDAANSEVHKTDRERITVLEEGLGCARREGAAMAADKAKWEVQRTRWLKLVSETRQRLDEALTEVTFHQELLHKERAKQTRMCEQWDRERKELEDKAGDKERNWTERVGVLEDDIGRLREELKVAQRRLAEEERLRQEALTESVELRKTMNSSSMEKTQAENAKLHLEKVLADMQRERGELSEIHRDYPHQSEETTQALQKEIRDLRQEQEKTLASNRELVSQNEKLTGDSTQTLKNLEELRGFYNGSTDIISSMRVKLSALEAERARLSEHNLHLTDLIRTSDKNARGEAENRESAANTPSKTPNTPTGSIKQADAAPAASSIYTGASMSPIGADLWNQLQTLTSAVEAARSQFAGFENVVQTLKSVAHDNPSLLNG